jgi:hypothetical protein
MYGSLHVANNYKLVLLSSARLRHAFHFNNLRSCPSATLRPYVLVSTPENNDDEYDLNRIPVVKS